MELDGGNIRPSVRPSAPGNSGNNSPLALTRVRRLLQPRREGLLQLRHRLRVGEDRRRAVPVPARGGPARPAAAPAALGVVHAVARAHRARLLLQLGGGAHAVQPAGARRLRSRLRPQGLNSRRTYMQVVQIP